MQAKQYKNTYKEIPTIRLPENMVEIDQSKFDSRQITIKDNIRAINIKDPTAVIKK